MLYTRGFLLAAAVAAAVTLAAIAELPASAGAAAVRHAPSLTDREALDHLGRAVGAHTFHRERLHEPDFDIAARALAAAELTQGHVRRELTLLADSASRSALEFLVDYNIAAGGWEAETGITMPTAAPAPSTT